ncbi:MAG: hypothetical protein KAS32_09805, partial [Candidatus Peribacteraceae bacterium]|nr:hypothetical protein [Candidatus Peribacteraceae bacterium]
EMTWEQLHEINHLGDVNDFLTDRQRAFISIAMSMNVPQWFLTESNWDMEKAEELSKKFGCSTKVAEYLETTLDSSIDPTDIASFLVVNSMGPNMLTGIIEEVKKMFGDVEAK